MQRPQNTGFVPPEIISPAFQALQARFSAPSVNSALTDVTVIDNMKMNGYGGVLIKLYL